MNVDPDLFRAKEALLAGDADQGIAILMALLDEPLRRSAAAHALGIVYDDGSDLRDPERAITFYSIAEDCGDDLATYRIAGILQRSGRIDEAFERFKKIHTSNPSAAYWCYRIVKDRRSGNDRHYLKAATAQGHVLAMRDDILQRIRGRDGVTAMPLALLELFTLFRAVCRVAGSRDRLLFT